MKMELSVKPIAPRNIEHDTAVPDFICDASTEHHGKTHHTKRDEADGTGDARNVAPVICPINAIAVTMTPMVISP